MIRNGLMILTHVNMTLTLILEKIVPNKRNIIRGSLAKMLFLEYITHTVVIINRVTNGNNGRIASINGLIFPVRFVYDLQKAFLLDFHRKCNKAFKKNCTHFLKN